MILVLFSMREEATEFVTWLRRQSEDYRQRVSVAYGGVGVDAVRKKVPGILDQHRPDLLIATGFAGALGDQPALGEAFLAINRTTLSHPFPYLRTALLHSAPSVIDSDSEREACARETAAQAVDMESETICQVAAAMNLPVLTIRAISDTADAPIPIPFAVSYDLLRQTVRRWPIFWWVFSQPHEWLSFFQFTIRIQTARISLSLALIRTLEQLLAEKTEAFKIASSCPES